jgi:hypothetical protein
VDASESARFHVELRKRTGARRAWEFNLSRERVIAQVIEPWRAGRSVAVGGRTWEPRESELRILEGPELELIDLDRGQGPGNAERTARNVTLELLGVSGESEGDAADAVAADIVAELRGLEGVVIENEEALGLVAERLRSLGLS